MKGFLEGKNIVITGAGSGIGKAIAIAVAKEVPILWLLIMV